MTFNPGVDEVLPIQQRMREILGMGESKVQDQTFRHSLKLKEWNERWTREIDHGTRHLHQ